MSLEELEIVHISRHEYTKLLRDHAELRALYEAGVDNWEGYGEAMKSLDTDF